MATDRFAWTDGGLVAAGLVAGGVTAHATGGLIPPLFVMGLGLVAAMLGR